MTPRAPHRFYHGGHIDPSAPLPEIDLSADESHHLLRVLRLREGALIDVFDAAGAAWSAEVAGAHGKIARVRLLGLIMSEAEHRPPINVAVAMLKRRATDLLIEKLSELGVDSLQPLISARTVTHGDGSAEGDTPARWDRLAIAAAKQCGRNRPLNLLPPVSIHAWLEQPRPSTHMVYAHPAPDAPPLGRWLIERSPISLPVWLVIGPEGGWTREETEAFAQAGFQPATLGGLTLRAETAAIAAAAACVLLGR